METSVGVNRGLTRPPQQEDSLLEAKRKQTGRRNEGRLLNFIDFTGWDQRAIQLLTCSIQDKGPQGNSEIIMDVSLVSQGKGEHCLGFNRPDDPHSELWGETHAHWHLLPAQESHSVDHAQQSHRGRYILRGPMCPKTRPPTQCVQKVTTPTPTQSAEPQVKYYSQP